MAMHVARICNALTLLTAILVFAPGARATAAPYYKDKTIRILTSEVGSGYDTVARFVARHLAAHIEGNPTVIVQNMPGATVKIPLYLTNNVPGDSTVIALLNNAVAFAPMMGIPQANFDPTKFNWLGSPSTETGVVLVWHTVPVNSIEDATRREVIMGVGGGASSATFYGKLLNSVLGTKFKLVTGYSGMASALLAMERGETEGFPNTLWNSLRGTKPEWIAEKKVKFLLQYSRIRNPDPALAGVPLARDVAKNAEDRQLIDAAVAPFDLGRPFTMAPGVDPEHVKIMQKAFAETLVDSAFLADAEKIGFEVEKVPRTGNDLLAIVADVYAAPQQVRDRLSQLYKSE
jgi:tripartite-type tricarboxylate transporter receptor subunit TctC